MIKVFVVTTAADEDSTPYVVGVFTTNASAQEFIDKETSERESVVWAHNREDDIRYEKELAKWRKRVELGEIPFSPPYRNQWYNEVCYDVEEFELQE